MHSTNQLHVYFFFYIAIVVPHALGLPSQNNPHPPPPQLNTSRRPLYQLVIFLPTRLSICSRAVVVMNLFPSQSVHGFFNFLLAGVRSSNGTYRLIRAAGWCHVPVSSQINIEPLVLTDQERRGILPRDR